MKIVTLTVDSIASDMLTNICHYQLITKKWKQRNNQWIIVDTSILREWDAEKKRMDSTIFMPAD